MRETEIKPNRFSRRDFLQFAAFGAASLAIGCQNIGKNNANEGNKKMENQTTDATNLSNIAHRKIQTNGINLHIAEAGKGVPVIFLHGFPELWYSWKNQLPALANAGYHAVAPDLRGYGESDAPQGVENYTMRKFTDDVIGLLDALKAKKAAVVGLDWGARIAWSCAQNYPQRVAAIVALGVPFTPRSPELPSEMLKKFTNGKFSIVEYFQKTGVAEAELEQNVRRSMTYFMATLYGASSPELLRKLYTEKPADSRLLDGMPENQPLPAWFSEVDLDYYTKSFERTGFGSALNLYRNMDADWRESTKTGNIKIEQPALFLGGDRDPATMFGSLEPMKQNVPNLRKAETLPDTGHLPQLQHSELINNEIIEFLRGESLKSNS